MSYDASQTDPFALLSIALEDYEQLPEIPAIYFVISADRVILYIGMTMRLKTRWSPHHVRHQLSEAAGVRVHWLPFGTTTTHRKGAMVNKKLKEAEEAFIQHFKPMRNRPRLASGVPITTMEQVDEIMQLTGISMEEVFVKAFGDLYQEVKGLANKQSNAGA